MKHVPDAVQGTGFWLVYFHGLVLFRAFEMTGIRGNLRRLYFRTSVTLLDYGLWEIKEHFATTRPK